MNCPKCGKEMKKEIWNLNVGDLVSGQIPEPKNGNEGYVCPSCKTACWKDGEIRKLE